jgi:hypothetical protein
MKKNRNIVDCTARISRLLRDGSTNEFENNSHLIIKRISNLPICLNLQEKVKSKKYNLNFSEETFSVLYLKIANNQSYIEIFNFLLSFYLSDVNKDSNIRISDFMYCFFYQYSLIDPSHFYKSVTNSYNGFKNPKCILLLEIILASTSINMHDLLANKKSLVKVQNVIENLSRYTILSFNKTISICLFLYFILF